MSHYALTFAVALLASLVFTWLVRHGARRFGLVAKPRVDRWHRTPTALYGGVGIYLAFMLSYFSQPPRSLPGNALLVACATGMFVVGLVDDRFRLAPYAKLVAQIILATVLTMSGTRLLWLTSPVMDQALTIFWLVGITNALNLLDNLDGLAGGIAVIASAFLVFFCHVSGEVGAAAMAAGFCGAVLGFLVFNVNPASIFMGDCGSLFVGFFLGGLATVTSATPGTRHNVMAVLALPVLLLLIPILDTTLVTVSRKMNGRPVSQGGRDHTSHRLVALGLSERRAALVLWTVAGLAGLVAVAVRYLAPPLTLFILPAFAMILLVFLVLIGRQKVYEPVSTEVESKGRALVPTLADFAYKRRIFEVLNDVVVVVLAYYGAFLLRFDGALVDPYYTRFTESLPVVLSVQVALLLVLGLYRGLWRYTSMNDLGTLVRSVGGAWTASVVVLVLVYRLEGFSRGVLLMDGVLLMVGIAGSRIFFRAVRSYLGRFRREPSSSRVLIYGAGDGGELLVRELLNNRTLGLVPVGFLDDDPAKHGRVIHGVRVVGALDRLSAVAGAQVIDEVVISTAKIDPERYAALGLLTQTSGIKTRRMRISLE